MHQINVLIFGPSSFLITLNELKSFLKFNYFTEKSNADYDVILFHEDFLTDKKAKDLIFKSESLKIYASCKNNILENFDAKLQLPASIKEINELVENITMKKKFNKNSSIKVKQYLLNKNEKKISKNNDFIILTEKEVQLVELLLKSPKSLTKEAILSTVWNYSAEADTHTVETHIYRLRKKISDKFSDENFIFNSKDGYYL